MLNTSGFSPGFARVRGAMAVLALVVLLSPSAFSGTVTLQNATATFSQTQGGDYPVSEAIDGITDATGWAIDGWSGSPPPIAVFQTVTDQGFVGGTLFTFNFYQEYGGSHTLGDFRLSVTTDNRSTFANGLPIGGTVAANWTVLDPLTAIATNGETLTIQADKSILASGAPPGTSDYTVTASTLLTGITGIRLETLQDSSLPSNGPGQHGNGNFVLSELTVYDQPLSAPEPGALCTVATALLGFCALLRQRLACGAKLFPAGNDPQGNHRI